MIKGGVFFVDSKQILKWSFIEQFPSIYAEWHKSTGKEINKNQKRSQIAEHAGHFSKFHQRTYLANCLCKVDQFLYFVSVSNQILSWILISYDNPNQLDDSIRGFFELNAMLWYYLGGGFKHFLFSPLPGEDSQFD